LLGKVIGYPRKVGPVENMHFRKDI
jgi:hypothetical protein